MDMFGHISVSDTWVTVQILCTLILKETIRMRDAVVLYEFCTFGQVVRMEGPMYTCMMSLYCLLCEELFNHPACTCNLCFLRLIEVLQSLA